MVSLLVAFAAGAITDRVTTASATSGGATAAVANPGIDWRSLNEFRASERKSEAGGGPGPATPAASPGIDWRSLNEFRASERASEYGDSGEPGAAPASDPTPRPGR